MKHFHFAVRYFHEYFNRTKTFRRNQPEHKQTQENLSNGKDIPSNGTGIDRSTWLSHITSKSMDTLSTHAIQVDLKSQVTGNRAYVPSTMPCFIEFHV